jgi:tRNA-modifying protein YgfZ
MRLIMVSSTFYPLNHLGIVKISGEKAGEFLQGQFTCDIQQVTEQKGSLGALCSHQGRILAIFYILVKANEYFCVLTESLVPSFIQHLEKFAIFSKVALEDVTKRYFLYGRKDEELLAEPYTISRQGEDLNLQLPGAFPRGLILSSQASENFFEGSVTEWKLMDINMGFTFIYPKTQGLVTPHMLNLPLLGAVSLNKGCYVGQEIIARTHYLGKSKRHLCQGEIQSEANLLPGDIIHSDGSEAGIIMDSVISKGKTHFLAVLQEPLDRELVANGMKIDSLLKLG